LANHIGASVEIASLKAARPAVKDRLIGISGTAFFGNMALQSAFLDRSGRRHQGHKREDRREKQEYKGHDRPSTGRSMP
jgi:hypothetical protein